MHIIQIELMIQRFHMGVAFDNLQENYWQFPLEPIFIKFTINTSSLTSEKHRPSKDLSGPKRYSMKYANMTMKYYLIETWFLWDMQ